jgi:hypothetical protein
VVIGDVTCGPNAIAPPVSAIPAAGAPIAVGLLAVAGISGILLRRRRIAAATSN